MKLTISSSSISPAQSATLSAVVKDSAGNAAPNIVVTFTTTSTYATFSPTSGTALTDSTGTATITLQAASATGASTVTASAILPTTSSTVGGTVTQTVAYQVSATQATLGLSALTIGSASAPIGTASNPLSAYGTVGITVTVQQTSNGSTTTYMSPVTVNFTSACASKVNANNKPFASITSTTTTVNGVATAQYVDNGCNATDTIQATINGVAGVSANSSLVVAAPSLGSIKFISVNPKTITLQGTGGAGLTQTSNVEFQVLDSGGNPEKATVNFTLNTSVGGVSLTSATAISDPVTGYVTTIVNAGTVPTPVRVTATVPGTSLSTESDVLSVSTGLPDQAHFSTSASTHNIEGWSYDGVTTSINVLLQDHFGNPVPDGTTVNFIVSGGGIQPSCTTSGGGCSVTLTSANPRPANGRVKVLAYAVGESCFSDFNGNGLFDNVGEFVDVNGLTCDLPEAFLDKNETGVYISPADTLLAKYTNYLSDSFIDFNQNNQFDVEHNTNGVMSDTGDGLYHGSFCSATAQTAGLCCTLQSISSGTCGISGYKPSINVRSQMTVKDPNTGTTTFRPFVVIFGGSSPMINLIGRSTSKAYVAGTQQFSEQYQTYAISNKTQATINVPQCGNSEVVDLYMGDVNFNYLPAGTQISVSTTKGSIVGFTGNTLADSVARAVPTVLPNGGQVGTDGNLYIGTLYIKDDGSLAAGVCTPSSTPSGVLTITSTSPTKKVVYSLDVNVSN